MVRRADEHRRMADNRSNYRARPRSNRYPTAKMVPDVESRDSWG